jgi:1,4-alpha-glucan branching enzyme
MYGGTDVGSGGGVQTQPVKMHGRNQSITLTLPPLGMLVLKYEPAAADAATASSGTEPPRSVTK